MPRLTSCLVFNRNSSNLEPAGREYSSAHFGSHFGVTYIYKKRYKNTLDFFAVINTRVEMPRLTSCLVFNQNSSNLEPAGREYSSAHFGSRLLSDKNIYLILVRF